jgi:hypothetical protein
MSGRLADATNNATLRSSKRTAVKSRPPALLPALDVSDLEEVEEGLVGNLRRSKTA